MKSKIYILIILVVGLVAGPLLAEPDTESKPSIDREYKIKAAFIYNFLKTVDWPEEVMSDSNEPIIIAIIGKEQFGDALDPIKDKTVKGKKVVVKRFEGPSQVDKGGPSGLGPAETEENSKTESEIDVNGLRKCHLLFVCSSEQKTFREIIELVKAHPVLTVGETHNFLEAGGIINFIPKAEKGEFEINLVAAEHARLKISSKLLRIANRVVEEKPLEKKKN